MGVRRLNLGDYILACLYAAAFIGVTIALNKWIFHNIDWQFYFCMMTSWYTITDRKLDLYKAKYGG